MLPLARNALFTLSYIDEALVGLVRNIRFVVIAARPTCHVMKKLLSLIKDAASIAYITSA